MKNLLKHTAVLFVLVLNSNTGTADTVDVTEGQLSASMLGIEVPERWMTQQEVEARFGAPISRSSSVGDPPISFWVYDQYTVYFEYDKVLHTVRNISTE